MRTILIRHGLYMRLSELAQGSDAVVQEVEDVVASDPIARRLRDYGFVARRSRCGWSARGPIGADPLLVQIGFTRFALRRAEAAIRVIDRGARMSDGGRQSAPRPGRQSELRQDRACSTS